MNTANTANDPSPRPGAGVHRGAGSAGGPRHTVPLAREEALRLLGSVSLGRIVFSQDALPAIRPVNHLVDRGEVVIRTHGGAAIAAVTREAGTEGVVVAYEADAIDPVTHLGWSVVVTGYCRLVTDPRDLAHYREVLHPWTDGQREHALRVRPVLVTGIRLTAALPAGR
ncbi:pyridoxamine 5'-phosphate oxidase family protein [Streptomyces sp. NPDC058773]|uniref:pyridoxamine 5'-phosphate oxidase family protein n=1 Tax=Streptomyces sp. NPDC058773 TaxID=3346632 RepID=UPI00367C911A